MFFTVILPIILGTFSMAFINVAKRGIMKGGALSPLQFLILYYGSAITIFGVVYVITWGFTWPETLPGLWTAVICGALVNTFIQFFNVKAASIDKGEVSLTAPLQAMTPGLISGLAIILGEYPSKLGIAGIVCMALGSYILLWEKTPTHWYEYFGPIKRVALLLKLRHLSQDERNKTIVVTLALGSACFGTVGLLFDGLYTRRSLGMQGLTLASMGLVGILCVNYVLWYLVFPDAKAEQRFANGFKGNAPALILLIGVLWVIMIYSIQPTFNHTFVAYTGTLKRLSILASVFLGYLFFKEADFKKRMWAAVVIIIGVILIGMDDLPTRISSHIEGIGL